MSNLIKYPYVNMQGKEAKVICYESEEEKFQPLDAKKKVVMKTFEEVAKEEKERAQEETGGESFQEGLPVTNYDEVIEEKIQKAEEEAAAAIAEARQQANEIVEQANNRKNQILEEGRQEGIARGYEEGLLQAQEEIQAQKDELSGQQLKKEQEYRQMLAETEGRYVDVLCNLIRKLSGVILTDRKDVILHLIRSGIADMEPAKQAEVRDQLPLSGSGKLITTVEPKFIPKEACFDGKGWNYRYNRGAGRKKPFRRRLYYRDR